MNSDKNVERSAKNPSPTDGRNGPNQFKLAAIFWITFAIGVGLAYLQQMNSPDIIVGGLVSLVIGFVLGGGIGLATGRLNDGLFWGTLIASFGFISVAGDPVGRPDQRLAWAAVGAVAGALSSTIAPNQSFRSISIAAISASGGALLVIWIFTSLAEPYFDMTFDIIAAPFIGAFVAVLVRIILWAESRHHMPRSITATWLLAIVIVGNLLAR